MRCRFCFARFQDVKQTILPKGHLNKEDALEVVSQLAEIGFEKITFAGGEPVLCPWLHELIATAKQAGLTTMIVTNGSMLTDQFLRENRPYLDWIAISVDSLYPETNSLIGRAVRGKQGFSAEYYFELADRIKQFGYGLKINTVVNRFNFSENLSAFIEYAKPIRWKVLQVLPIAGQNDTEIEKLKISNEQFQHFLETHKHLRDFTKIIPENNEQMKGSYAMVDPAGRFFDNTSGKHRYSQLILKIGARLAIQQVNYSFEKFIDRGGIYHWRWPQNLPKRITLSGEVASGKSTIGKLLAEKLGYTFVSIGDKIRAYAESKKMNILEFQKECLKNPDTDKQIDLLFSEECNAQENLVIDYRLGFKFITDAFHIYLKVSEKTAVERLKYTGRANETHLTVQERNAIFTKQFLNAYQIDYTNDSNYDIIVDVDVFDSAEKIVELILQTLYSGSNPSPRYRT